MVIPYFTERMPDELLLIMPPSVALLVVAGSGAKNRPYSASRWFKWSRTMPGCTRAQRSSALTSSTLFMCLEKSSTMPGPNV